MLTFNKNKIKTGIDSLPYYRVMYEIHPFNKVPDFSGIDFETYKDKGTACYSGLFCNYNKCNSPKDHTWLTSLYLAKPFVSACGTKFSEKHVARWIELCTKYKLLPPTSLFKYSMDKIDVKENKQRKILPGEHIRLVYTLFIDGVFQPTLYLWLDNFRHLREDQGLVLATLYLHDELGIDFYVSYIIASYFNISNTGHHSLKISQSTLYDNPATKAPRIREFKGDEVVDLKLASVLYRACENFYKLACDSPQAKYILKFLYKSGDDRATGWSCNGIHQSMCAKEKDLIVPLKYLDHDSIGRIVRAETEAERQSLLELIK